MTDQDRAALAELLRSDMWRRVCKDVLRHAQIDPRGNGQDAAKIGLDLAFCSGLNRFPALLEELVNPAPTKESPSPRHLTRTPRRPETT